MWLVAAAFGVALLLIVLANKREEIAQWLSPIDDRVGQAPDPRRLAAGGSGGGAEEVRRGGLRGVREGTRRGEGVGPGGGGGPAGAGEEEAD